MSDGAEVRVLCDHENGVCTHWDGPRHGFRVAPIPTCTCGAPDCILTDWQRRTRLGEDSA